MKSMINPLEANTQVEVVAEIVSLLEPAVQAIKQQMQKFEQSLGPRTTALRKEIENGVDDCKDRSDLGGV